MNPLIVISLHMNKWLMKELNNVIGKISRWWNGEIYKNPPDSKFVYIGFVYHPSATLVRKVYSFLRKEYKFLLGTIIAVVGIIFSVLS